MGRLEGPEPKGLLPLRWLQQWISARNSLVSGRTVVNSIIPDPTGSKHERGILAWNEAHESDSNNTLESEEVYNLPFGIGAYSSSFPWLRHIPFCPPGTTGSLEEAETNTNSLENKKTLGHLPPSQVVIGATLWVVCSYLSYFVNKQKCKIYSEAAHIRFKKKTKKKNTVLKQHGAKNFILRLEWTLISFWDIFMGR